MDDFSPLLNTKEAANFYNYSPRTLEHWRLVGVGPKFVRIGRHVRYRRVDLTSYLETRIRQSTSDHGD